MIRDIANVNSTQRQRTAYFPHLRKRRWYSLIKHTSITKYSIISHKSSASFIIASIVLFACVTCWMIFFRHNAAFDDIRDMQLVEEADALFLAQKQNVTAEDTSNPLRSLNATEVKGKRLAWDYIYGAIMRRSPPPVLTKYKTRLLRELFQETYYKSLNKYSPAVDVSCNYLNDIPSGSLHTFQCSDTSHRCPDGGFSLKLGFAPQEGVSITWDDVVIVIAIANGSEPYLEAAAETWIPRIRPEASIYFARDGSFPDLPESLKRRKNTYIYEYPGEIGFESLDMKVYLTLNMVYQRFAPVGKKYFIKIDVDTYLYGHNLIRLLNRIEHNFGAREEALYFGHPFCGHGDVQAMGYEKWCYAGGGAYGMSVEALLIFLTQIKGGCAYFYDYVASAPDYKPIKDKYGGRYEDIMIGRCIRQARARSQLRGTSLLACGSFFPYAPLHYYHAFGNSKEAMCKKLEGDLITLHNLEPSAMRYLDNFLFEYPLGAEVTPFSPENENLDTLIEQCSMNGKKMSCNMSQEVFKRSR